MAAELGFRGPQAVALAGITYRQLDYWARTDLVRPSLAEAQGSGTQRRYSTADIVSLRVVAAICHLGGPRGGGGIAVNDPRIHRAIRLVRNLSPAADTDGLLVLSSVDVRVLTDPLDVAALLFTTEPLLLVPLAPLYANLDDVQQ